MVKKPVMSVAHTLISHIPHPDWALLRIIEITGKSAQHPGL
jgi:hypothetical protein